MPTWGVCYYITFFWDYRGHAPALVFPLVGSVLGQIGCGSSGRLHTDCHNHCIPCISMACIGSLGGFGGLPKDK